MAKKATRKGRSSRLSRRGDSNLERRTSATTDLEIARELLHGPVALAGYTRIQLKIVGDLCAVVQNWTKAEHKVRRRLVEFRRAQIGGALVCLESAIAGADAASKQPSITISCIQWPNEPEYFFVTSFNVIRLVEFTLQTTMTTEIKNRARRNMASIPSRTLPRVKIPEEPDIDLEDEPYALVMSFDSPKPRSIEKSIKVFDWKHLEGCISKILSRFVSNLHAPVAL